MRLVAIMDKHSDSAADQPPGEHNASVTSEGSSDPKVAEAEPAQIEPRPRSASQAALTEVSNSGLIGLCPSFHGLDIHALSMLD